MKETIKIGTRGSKLAMWQAEFVARMLNDEGINTEIIPIETKGDVQLNQGFADIGSKGIFTEEIEKGLMDGSIDIAVHSAKDLQSVLPDSLEILAFMEREMPSDVLVSFDQNFSLSDQGKPVVVGTSSTRRRAFLKYYYPHIMVAEARGNLQTRFQKMEDGQYAAMILAFAGVHRMEYDKHIVKIFSTDMLVPAVGQGCIAIESCKELDPTKKEQLKNILNHKDTETCLLAERAFLRTIEGGCSIPVFGYAEKTHEGIFMVGGIIEPAAKQLIRESEKAKETDAEGAGIRLAERVLSKGGDVILKNLKKG